MPPSPLPPQISSALSASLKAQTALVHNTPALTSALTNSTAKGLPRIAISPAQGQQLSLLCQALNATRVLEIGTLGGYSTLWFATASPSIRVTSIEIDAHHAEVARENIRAAGEEVNEQVEILLGKAGDVLPRLVGEGAVFDMVFIDANWESQAAYFDWAVKLTRKGGMVYVDNAVRQITETLDEGGREAEAMALVEAVGKDERVQGTLIPTLNTHKESLEGGIADGYLMAVVL